MFFKRGADARGALIRLIERGNDGCGDVGLGTVGSENVNRMDAVRAEIVFYGDDDRAGVRVKDLASDSRGHGNLP